EFFYRFHFQFHYMPVLWGRYLAGLCAMFMLVAIVSGVITHKKIFTDFFTFRPRKGQRSWLDAHNATAVLALPFHIV
ncbi:PepSY-associated TM helix domain-containing protein, partial [Acinetobacter sp. NS4_7]